MRLPPFVRGAGIGIAVGAVAGIGLATLLQQQRGRPAQLHAPSNSPVFKYGMPVSDVLREYDQFAVSFDTRLRNPRWVLERVTKDSSSGTGNRAAAAFVEDEGIDARFRNKLTDFQMSGYDRGHMAPAANHKGSQRALEETFKLTNISPQVGKGFNRDYWARFEHFVKKLTDTCEEVFVVTGPLYLPRLTRNGYSMGYSLIGEVPNLVAVPTHYFKVVLAESKSRNLLGAKQTVVGAFVCPNAPIDPDMPLTSFAVPLEALESASGLHFFPDYLTPPKRQALDAAALGWQREGRKRGRQAQEINFFLDQQPLSTQASSRLLAEPEKRKRGRPRKVVPSPEDDTTALETLKGGWGTLHVCDHVACRLPPPEFWKPPAERSASGPLPPVAGLAPGAPAILSGQGGGRANSV